MNRLFSSITCTSRPRILAFSFTGIGAGASIFDLPRSVLFHTITLPEPGSQLEKDYVQNIEKEIKNLEIFKSLSTNPDIQFSRPLQEAPERYYAEADDTRTHNLTQTHLTGPGRMTLPPFIFYDNKSRTLTQIVHCGPNVCGFPTIIHGGFLAILLDEAIGRIAARTLPGRTGVTAFLNINYKAPTYANQVLAITAKVTKLEGTKVFVEATVTPADKPSQLLVTAESLFVEPKKFNVRPH